jgi:hypothetical protein
MQGGSTVPFRGWEFISGVLNGCEVNIFGGNTEGGFTGSAFFELTNAGQNQNTIRVYGTHFEATSGAMTDGGSVVVDSSSLWTFAGASLGGFGGFVTKATNQNPELRAFASNFGTVTLVAGTTGIISGSNLGTVTDNASNVTYLGNKQGGGQLQNKIVSAWGSSPGTVVGASALGFPVGAPVFVNNLQVRAVDSTGQGQPFFNAHDGSDNTNLYYQSGKVLNITNTVGTTPTTTKMTVSDSGLALAIPLTGTGAFVPVSLLNSGTGASSTTFWRGDGTWAAPAVVTVTAVNLTAQQANIAATTLVTPGANGFYRFSCYVVLTQAATTSSTLPDCQLLYTDPDSNIAEAIIATAESPSNALGQIEFLSTTTPFSGGFFAKSGVAIRYATINYASSGATVMQYAIHVRLEGPL